MDSFAPLIGVVIVAFTLVDIYLTVLYPTFGSSLISLRIGKLNWWFFRQIAYSFPKKNSHLLSFSGSTLIVTILVVWVSLLISGFALIIWPGLGTGIQASEGVTPTDFITALYYSAFSLTTLGTGDLFPVTAGYRLLTIIEAALGFSVFTLTLTYLLSVYSAIVRRNSFALSLNHSTSMSADAAALLSRMGGARGNLDNIEPEIAHVARDLMNLLESQHSYPVLLYFRFQQVYYGLPRLILVTLDAASLIKSILPPEKYQFLQKSAAVSQLWGGALQLLSEISQELNFPQNPKISPQWEHQWRSRYYKAAERLQMEGIEIVNDLESGADYYIALRREWGPCLVNLSHYMAYSWNEISPIEFP